VKKVSPSAMQERRGGWRDAAFLGIRREHREQSVQLAVTLTFDFSRWDAGEFALGPRFEALTHVGALAVRAADDNVSPSRPLTKTAAAPSATRSQTIVRLAGAGGNSSGASLPMSALSASEQVVEKKAPRLAARAASSR